VLSTLIELGLALREIKLQALASGDSAERIQITGSAKIGAKELYILMVLQACRRKPAGLLN